jgi:hypothetical protein
MTQMLHKVYAIVQQDPRLADLSIYTISTIPERFPAMPHFLKKHGKPRAYDTNTFYLVAYVMVGYVEFTRDEIFDELLKKRTDKIRLFHSIQRLSSS